MTRILLALLMTFGLAGSAAADIPPGPRPRPVKRIVRIPTEALDVVAEFAAALKTKDVEKAKALVDARGWSVNLVGGSGQAMEDTYREGANEGWYTRALPESQQEIYDAWIVSADIVGKDGRVLDRVDMLLVKVDGKWKILGAGEKREQVIALATRLSTGQDLAPPPRKPE